jgi:hypothetical protein
MKRLAYSSLVLYSLSARLVQSSAATPGHGLGMGVVEPYGEVMQDLNPPILN